MRLASPPGNLRKSSSTAALREAHNLTQTGMLLYRSRSGSCLCLTHSRWFILDVAEDVETRVQFPPAKVSWEIFASGREFLGKLREESPKNPAAAFELSAFGDDKHPKAAAGPSRGVAGNRHCPATICIRR